MSESSIPKIELFAIGTELILGRVQDTNSFWICQRITELGGNLRRVTMITDDEPDIVQAVGDSLRRGTDVIITMGGLGPTDDDRTVATLGRMLGLGVSVHEPTVLHYMERRSLKNRSEVTPGLIKMATVINGAHIVHNPQGWAPCVHITVNDLPQSMGQNDNVSTNSGPRHILILPGPPRELTALFDFYVAPFLQTLFKGFSVTHRVYIHAFESELAPIFQLLMNAYPRTYMKAMIAKRQEDPDRGLPVDIVAVGGDEAEARGVLQELLDDFVRHLWEIGKTVSSEDDLFP